MRRFATRTLRRATAAPNPLLRLPAPADNAAMIAEPLKSASPKRKRRWFQFSLRSDEMGSVPAGDGFGLGNVGSVTFG